MFAKMLKKSDWQGKGYLIVGGTLYPRNETQGMFIRGQSGTSDEFDALVNRVAEAKDE